MDELKSKLVLHDSMDDTKIQELITDLNQIIFDNYKISNGKHAYSILEIEYYIYTPQHEDMRSTMTSTTVYKRPGKSAGDVFFHYSGMDICFDPDKQSFGGILIRSLVNESDNHIIKGPWNCLMELLNNGSSLPHVIRERSKLKYTEPQASQRKNLDSQNPYAYNYKRKIVSNSVSR